MSKSTSILPDNAFLLWLQDKSNNEYLTPESLTQMYTHLAPLVADDPLDTFKKDDRNHSFLVFMKHHNNNISKSYLMHHMSMLALGVGQPAQYAGRYFFSSGDNIHNQFVTHELPVDFLKELNPFTHNYSKTGTPFHASHYSPSFAEPTSLEITSTTVPFLTNPLT